MIAAATGCATTPNPHGRPSTTQTGREHFCVARYWPEYETVIRTYVRTSLAARGKTRQRVRQVVNGRGRAEGSLAGRVSWPLSQFLDPHSNRPDRAMFDWPQPAQRASAGYFIAFDPPITRWPDGLSPGTPHRQHGRMVAFDRGGRPFAYGTVDRVVWFEGLESIDAARRTYPRCAVLRSVTTLGFSWWARVVLDERVWLAEHIGVVRRDERIHGTLVIVLPFRAAHRYELESLRPVGLPTDHAVYPRPWHIIAMHLDRLPPRPRLGGLSVEWDAIPPGTGHPSVP